MSLTVSIRFLTGRAHLHHWQAHHSDGKVDWPPSPWRLLRALVAAAGSGLTTLPEPLDKTLQDTDGDAVPLSRLGNLVATLAALPEIWLPRTSGGHTRQFFPRHEGGTVKPTGSAVFDTFAVISKDQPLHFHWPSVELPPEQFADLEKILRRLTYFGRAESWCEATAIAGVPPGLEEGKTHWRCLCVDDDGPPPGLRDHTDYTMERKLSPCLPLLPGLAKCSLAEEAVRLFSGLLRPQETENTVGLDAKDAFGSFPVESWQGRLELRAVDEPKGKKAKPWELVARGDWTEDEVQACINAGSLEKAAKKKLTDLLNKRATATASFAEWERELKSDATDERIGRLLLRCLLRASGEDMKAGLERPIGTRWVHYAVPRAIYQLPSALRAPARPKAVGPPVTLVRFALNTATVNRPVLPPIADTLLFADKFRAATLAWHGHLKSGEHPRNLCGREESQNGERIVTGHDHAFFWPTDEDNDGFIDHVSVFCPSGFLPAEVDALRRLLRLRQRGGRPDILVTPVFLGQHEQFWLKEKTATTFVSATPYFCPKHLGHGKKSGGATRSIAAEILVSLRLTRQIVHDSEVARIDELIFCDYEPTATAAPNVLPSAEFQDLRYTAARLKSADAPLPPGAVTGLKVEGGTRLIRALAFVRKRRRSMIQNLGRMFRIEFASPRVARPFSIGSQAHFGLGLFVPVAAPANVLAAQERG